jgi:hypothetical protein
VRVVLQAANKLEEPHFDADVDVRVLRLLGKVAMEVLQVCQDNSAASMNAKRKDALLQLLTDQVPCQEPLQLLHAVENGLKDIFVAQDAALYLVHEGERSAGDFMVKLQISKLGPRKVLRTRCDELKGVVGNVAWTKNQFSIVASQLGGSCKEYDPHVDLDVPEHTVLHTVPILEGNSCRAVVQFVCQERDGAAIGDDGAYHPENTSHFKILHILLTFVQKHLAVLSQRRPSATSEETQLGEGGTQTADAHA